MDARLLAHQRALNFWIERQRARGRFPERANPETSPKSSAREPENGL